MEETSNVPKLRFKYEDTWQSSKLHFLADIKTGNKDLKDNVEGGKYPFFVRSNHVERINSYSFDGEAILIPGDGNVGQIYHYIIGKFDFHQRVYKISNFDSNIMGKYIYYYFQKNFLKEALRNSVKATVDSLRLPTIKNFIINYPSIKEQEKIVKMLNSIEKKINLLYKQQDALNDFKKFCLQNLFSDKSKLRFKNLQVEDNSDWKKFILKDILLSSSSNLSMADLEDNFGDYKLYGATGFIKCIDFFDQKEGYMAIVKDGAGVGKTFLCDPKSSVLSTLLYLTPKKDYNLKFCYYLLKTLHFGKYKVGSTIPHIYYKDFSKEKVFIPSVEEQEKIARFLTAIDKKIDFTQNQITEMEKFKKGLLQQMFV